MSNQPPQNPYNQPPQGPPPGGGYGAAPQMSGGGFAPAPNVAKPKSIDLAVKLMYVGAALSLLGIVISFFMKGAIEDEARKQIEEAGTTADIDKAVDTAVMVGMAIGVVAGLIGVALWLLMAKFNGDGKSWARIVATVLGVLNVLFTLMSFAQPGTMASRLPSLISVVLAIVILVLLWKKESTAYYQARSMPR